MHMYYATIVTQTCIIHEDAVSDTIGLVTP